MTCVVPTKIAASPNADVRATGVCRGLGVERTIVRAETDVQQVTSLRRIIVVRGPREPRIVDIVVIADVVGKAAFVVVVFENSASTSNLLRGEYEIYAVSV